MHQPICMLASEVLQPSLPSAACVQSSELPEINSVQSLPVQHKVSLQYMF